MAVVTISNLFGSGGSEIAKSLARRLDYRYFDRKMVDPIAEELGLTKGESNVLHEGHHGILFNLVDKLSAALLRGVTDKKSPERKIPPRNQDAFMEQIEEMLLLLAEDNNLVILGWGGQVVLRDVPHTVHVRLVVEEEDRLKRIMDQRRCTQVSARELINRRDADAARFIQHYWKQEWENPRLYDIVLNISHLGEDVCEEMIMALLKNKGHI